jgi:hypothetical protein
MMVEERVQRDEEEDRTWYDFQEAEVSTSLDPAAEHVERQDAEMRLHRRLQEAFYQGPAINIDDLNYQRQMQRFDAREEAINRRWDMLHDADEHFRLREALMQQVRSNMENNNLEVAAP